MLEFSLAALAIVPLTSVELAKAARWRVLFGPHPPPFALCLRALVAGQMTNALSPVRAGEAVRLGALAAQGGALLPGTAAMAGAKAIDTLCLAAIAAAVVGSAALAHARWGLGAGGLVVLLGVLLAVRGAGVRDRLERFPIARKLRLSALVDVAGTLRDPASLLVVLGATALAWAAGLAANGVVLAAVGVTPTFDLMARVLVAGYVAGMLPAPPVRLGVFEAGVTVALTSAGVPLPQAIAAGVTLHVCQLAELGLLLAFGVLGGRFSPRRHGDTERLRVGADGHQHTVVKPFGAFTLD